MSLNAILNLINREQVWASTIIGLPSIADYPSFMFHQTYKGEL